MVAGTKVSADIAAHQINGLSAGVSIRHGAHRHLGASGISHQLTADIAGHRECDGVGSISSHWDYQPILETNVITACMPLAGWHWTTPGVFIADPNRFTSTPQPPSLDCLSEFDQEKLDRVCDLFLRIQGDSQPDLRAGGELRMLSYTMLASVLRFLPELETICNHPNSQNQTVNKLFAAFAQIDDLGSDHDERRNRLMALSMRIKGDFFDKNQRFFIESVAADNSQLFDQVNASVALTHKRLSSLEVNIHMLDGNFRQTSSQIKSDLRTMADSIRDMHSTIAKLVQLTSSIAYSMASTQTPPRRRVSASIDQLSSALPTDAVVPTAAELPLFSGPQNSALPEASDAPAAAASSMSAALNTVGNVLPKLSSSVVPVRICLSTELPVKELFHTLITQGISFDTVSDRQALITKVNWTSSFCDKFIAAHKMFINVASNSDIDKWKKARGASDAAELESSFEEMERKFRIELTKLSTEAVQIAGTKLTEQMTILQQSADKEGVRKLVQKLNTANTALKSKQTTVLTAQVIANYIQYFNDIDNKIQWRDRLQSRASQQPVLRWGNTAINANKSLSAHESRIGEKRSAAAAALGDHSNSVALEVAAPSSTTLKSASPEPSDQQQQQGNGIFQSLKSLFGSQK